MAKGKKLKLEVDPRNARLHPPRNEEAAEKSLGELGAGRSVLADRNGVLVAGNLIYEKALKLGIPIEEVHTEGDKLIVVVRDDLATDDPKRKALALADNQIALLAEWDEEVLGELKLETVELDVSVMGFPNPEPIELDKLLTEVDMSVAVEKPIWMVVRADESKRYILEKAVALLEGNGLRVETSYG